MIYFQEQVISGLIFSGLLDWNPYFLVDFCLNTAFHFLSVDPTWKLLKLKFGSCVFAHKMKVIIPCTLNLIMESYVLLPLPPLLISSICIVKLGVLCTDGTTRRWGELGTKLETIVECEFGFTIHRTRAQIGICLWNLRDVSSRDVKEANCIMKIL